MASASGPRPFRPMSGSPRGRYDHRGAAELNAMTGSWRAAFAAPRSSDARSRVGDPGGAVRRLPGGGNASLRRGARRRAIDAVGEFITAADDSNRSRPTVAGSSLPQATIRAVDLLADRRRVDALRSRAMASVAGCDALMVPTAPSIRSMPRSPPTGGRERADGDLHQLLQPVRPLRSGSCGRRHRRGCRRVAQFGVTFLAPAHHDAVLVDLARRLREESTWSPRAGVDRRHRRPRRVRGHTERPAARARAHRPWGAVVGRAGDLAGLPACRVGDHSAEAGSRRRSRERAIDPW